MKDINKIVLSYAKNDKQVYEYNISGSMSLSGSDVKELYTTLRTNALICGADCDETITDITNISDNVMYGIVMEEFGYGRMIMSIHAA